MTAAFKLLEILTEHGIRVRPDGEALRLKPKSRLTPELLADVRAHKLELLVLLGDDSSQRGIPYCQPDAEGRCARCLELEAQGVKTLMCSECGYRAELQISQPSQEDLKYPLDYVRRRVPRLSSPHRERYDYWLDLMNSAGWSPEDAERAAFRRVITGPPNSQKEEVTDVRTENLARDRRPN